MGYLRPRRLEDALDALSRGPCAILAGGTDHFPARVSHSPAEDILDITALPGLRDIGLDDAAWRIPCGATWGDVIAADLPPMFDGLAQAARQVGGRQVQNTGTVVGNLCNASPAADGIPCLLALDAEVELASASGARAMKVADFVLGPRRTARRADEMVLGLRIPANPAAASGFEKLGARRYLVISIVMVAVAARLVEGYIAEARVAIGACGPVARRLPEVEAALLGQHARHPAIDPACFAALSPIDDIRADAEYRRAAAIEVTHRAIRALAA